MRGHATDRLAAAATLADLAAQPERIADVPPSVAVTLLAQLAALQVPLLARALGGPAGGGADELLTVDAAAQRLGLSEAWLYRHAARLPFTVRVNRQVRFSARRLEAYIAARAGGRPSCP